MKTETLSIKEIVTTANAGTVLEQGIKEAIILSLTENECVTFTHNSKTYRVEPKKVVGSIDYEEKI